MYKKIMFKKTDLSQTSNLLALFLFSNIFNYDNAQIV